MLLVGMFGVCTKKGWLNKQAMAVFQEGLHCKTGPAVCEISTCIEILFPTLTSDQPPPMTI